MNTSLEHWTPRERPSAEPMEGRYVRLEKLDSARHGDDLFEASSTGDADARFRWLFEYPPASRAEFQPWLDKAASSTDPFFFAVIDKASGKVAGRQAFMRIDTAHGVIEIGSILWNPPLARQPGATEALYLFARHAFEDLGYRRFEWKCNNDNEPSKRAAVRFGFTYEGTFRQHMVAKGKNRDTAWFSMIDSEWPTLRAAFEEWLDPSNFDSEGRQRKRLEEIRAAIG
jgi:RimJ/RimL family protein N-acetyltransferase